MGRVIKLLAKKTLKKESDIYSDFVSVELAECFHWHWRNTRLGMNRDEFINFCKAIRMAESKYAEIGMPVPNKNTDTMTPPFYLMSGKMPKEHGDRPEDLSIEVNSTPWEPSNPESIHVHYRSLRIDLSFDEFKELAKAIVEAKEGLANYEKEKEVEHAKGM